jgi:hypothetical protein
LLLLLLPFPEVAGILRFFPRFVVAAAATTVAPVLAGGGVFCCSWARRCIKISVNEDARSAADDLCDDDDDCLRSISCGLTDTID